MNTARERALRASWIAAASHWHDQITIREREATLRNPARPGANPVVKLARYARRSGRRNAKQNPTQTIASHAIVWSLFGNDHVMDVTLA